jgi:hypothetical protein
VLFRNGPGLGLFEPRRHCLTIGIVKQPRDVLDDLGLTRLAQAGEMQAAPDERGPVTHGAPSKCG